MNLESDTNNMRNSISDCIREVAKEALEDSKGILTHVGGNNRESWWWNQDVQKELRLRGIVLWAGKKIEGKLFGISIS